MRAIEQLGSSSTQVRIGTISPGQPGFERGADLRQATLTGARLSNIHDFRDALTDGAVGLADAEPALQPSGRG